MSYDTDDNGIPIAEPAMPPMQWITTEQPLTKRERFAKAALTGLCSNCNLTATSDQCIALLAVRQADYAIAALKSTPEPE